MTEASQKPTLLAFTRGAEEESACRRLLPRRLDSVERRLHHQCLRSVLDAGREAGCSLVVSSPRSLALPPDATRLPQVEKGLGRRVREALKRALDASAGPVILVGTDVPSLAPRHLNKALEHLRSDPESVVVGPSPDGGFYLLATTRPLDRELAGVRWCTRNALASLEKALRRRGITVHSLEPLEDLDRPQDLAGWASRDSTGSVMAMAMTKAWYLLRQLIRQALAGLVRIASPRTLGRPALSLTGVFGGRSPPRRG